ncbi:MAG: hypothetical protein AB1424_18690 [Thermodesulfobacteriota bacterium]
MRFRLIIVTILCLVLTSPLIAADLYSDVPLPKDLRLQGKAASGLTARAWSGRWRNPASPPAEGLNAILIFEKVAGKKAAIIYAFGDSPELKIKAGWARHKVDLVTAGKKSRFSFTSKLGHVLDFEMEGDKLNGNLRGKQVNVVMTPCKLGEK